MTAYTIGDIKVDFKPVCECNDPHSLIINRDDEQYVKLTCKKCNTTRTDYYPRRQNS